MSPLASESRTDRGLSLRSVNLMRGVLSGSGSLATVLRAVLARLLIVVLNAATGIIVARVLLPEGRGRMAAMIMWPGLLASMMTLGLPSALIYNLQRFPSRSREFTGTALALALTLGVATAAAGSVLVPLYLAGYPPEVTGVARWFLLSAPLPLLTLAGRAALEARQDFAGSNAALWLNPALTLAALVFLALTGSLTVLSGGLAYVLSGIPVLLWLLVRVWRASGALWCSIQAAGTLLHFGIRSYGIDILNALAMQADQVLVVGFLSPSAMGTYVVATSLARILSVFHGSVVMVLFPRAAAKQPDEVLAVTGRAVRLTSALGLTAAPLAMLVGPSLLTLLYGRAYAGAGTLLCILVCDVLLSGNAQVLSQAFMALGRPGVIATVNTIGVGMSVLLMSVLIPRFGVTGAAIAMVISSAGRLIATLMCFGPFLNRSAPGMWLNAADVSFLLAKVFRSGTRQSTVVVQTT